MLVYLYPPSYIITIIRISPSIYEKHVVYAFVIIGGYTFYTKYGTETSNWYKIVGIWAFFIFSVVVYMVGKKYDCFCFNPIHDFATFYHGLMHVLSSFGHNLIILFDYY